MSRTPDPDRIRLAGLSARGYHGVLPFEREEGQIFAADVTLELGERGTAVAAVTDALEDVVDYSAVGRAVVDVIEGEPVNLLETLAERVSDAVLAFARVSAVTVTVHKPQAPLDVAFDDVAVTIRREREGAQSRPSAPTTTEAAAAQAAGLTAPAAAALPLVPGGQPGQDRDAEVDPGDGRGERDAADASGGDATAGEPAQADDGAYPGEAEPAAGDQAAGAASGEGAAATEGEAPAQDEFPAEEPAPGEGEGNLEHGVLTGAAAADASASSDAASAAGAAGALGAAGAGAAGADLASSSGAPPAAEEPEPALAPRAAGEPETALAAPAAGSALPSPASERRAVDVLDQRPESPVEVVIALGGNVGGVVPALRTAVNSLSAAPGIDVTDVAPLARTAAVVGAGGASQPDYLNTVVLAQTTLSPREVLALCQDLESAAGRARLEPHGPRTLDADVVTYEGVTSQDESLTLPHPRASQRAFVLVPWAHADPYAEIGDQAVATLAEEAPDRDGVRWLALDWLESDHLPALPTGQYVAPPQAPEPPKALAEGSADAAAPRDAEPAGADPALPAPEPPRAPSAGAVDQGSDQSGTDQSGSDQGGTDQGGTGQSGSDALSAGEGAVVEERSVRGETPAEDAEQNPGARSGEDAAVGSEENPVNDSGEVRGPASGAVFADDAGADPLQAVSGGVAREDAIFGASSAGTPSSQWQRGAGSGSTALDALGEAGDPAAAAVPAPAEPARAAEEVPSDRAARSEEADGDGAQDADAEDADEEPWSAPLNWNDVIGRRDGQGS